MCPFRTPPAARVLPDASGSALAQSPVSRRVLLLLLFLNYGGVISSRANMHPFNLCFSAVSCYSCNSVIAATSCRFSQKKEEPHQGAQAPQNTVSSRLLLILAIQMAPNFHVRKMHPPYMRGTLAHFVLLVLSFMTWEPLATQLSACRSPLRLNYKYFQ